MIFFEEKWIGAKTSKTNVTCHTYRRKEGYFEPQIFTQAPPLTGKDGQSDRERNFLRYYLPPATLKKQRTRRFCFLPNRNGRFDKAISPSGISENVYVSHRNNNGCFFESSVPIRKRLCGLRDFAVHKPITG